jgi:hypothetical protein
MEAQRYYYHKPKVIFVSILMALFLFGFLALSVIFKQAIFIIITLFLMPIAYFLIADGVVPTIKNRAVLIADENGLTDIISWGLIEWSNVKELKVVRGVGHWTYHTEMYIFLKDLSNYQCYNQSWWIRFKVKFNKIYKGIPVDIVMDIHALDGNANDVFKSINDMYELNR